MFLLAAAVGLFIFFRGFILSGGRWIVGGPADGRLIMALHEHWFRFLKGKEGWFELSFFYPEKNVLGYSDTFLLGGIFHSVFRAIGTDPYLAFQLTQISFALAGFTGMVLWLSRYRKLGFNFALFGGILLLVASPIYLSSRNTHIQMQAVWLMPWIAILLEQVWRDLHSNPKGLLFSFTFLCFAYGLVAYSTFYIAWFCLLFMAIWFVCAGFLLGWSRIWELLIMVTTRWRRLIPGLILGVGWLTMFVVTYLPVRLLQGGRSLGEAIKSLPHPWDFINHSQTNLLWGSINSHFHSYPSFRYWELELGPTLIFTVLVVASSIVLWKSRESLCKSGKAFYLVTGVALLVSFILMIRISLLSLWILPYFLVPGADAIRVGIRFMVFLVVPSIPVILWGLQQLNNRVAGIRGGLMVASIALLLLAEQIHTVSIAQLDRTEQLRTLENLPDPPVDATAFIPVARETNIHKVDVIQAGVITYAQHWDLPVCGGRSGFFPEGWTLEVLNPPEVYPKAMQWAIYKGIEGKLYFFNVDTNRWGRPLPPIDERRDLFWLKPGHELIDKELTREGPLLFGGLAVHGWSGREDWGVWSVSKKAEILIPQIKEEALPVFLQMKFGAYLTKAHPRQRVRLILDGKEILDTVISMGDPPVQIDVEIKEGSQSLQIETPDAISPKALGEHPDPRVLGISVSSLTFTRY
jgi:hypothetical protein